MNGEHSDFPHKKLPPRSGQIARTAQDRPNAVETYLPPRLNIQALRIDSDELSGGFWPQRGGGKIAHKKQRNKDNSRSTTT